MSATCRTYLHPGEALRIGINLGDVIGKGSDIYGAGVNIGARLELQVGESLRGRTFDWTAWVKKDSMGPCSVFGHCYPLNDWREGASR
jgi:hypothetical protein